MTVPDRQVVERPTRPSSPAELLESLHGLEHQPLDVQVELLEAVRRGLDEAMGRSAEQNPRQ